jgi:hypothetical protein
VCRLDDTGAETMRASLTDEQALELAALALRIEALLRDSPRISNGPSIRPVKSCFAVPPPADHGRIPAHRLMPGDERICPRPVPRAA